MNDEQKEKPRSRDGETPAAERPAPDGENVHEDQADGFVAAEPGEPDLGPTEREARRDRQDKAPPG